jgi:hypothetical protein
MANNLVDICSSSVVSLCPDEDGKYVNYIRAICNPLALKTKRTMTRSCVYGSLLFQLQRIRNGPNRVDIRSISRLLQRSGW